MSSLPDAPPASPQQVAVRSWLRQPTARWHLSLVAATVAVTVAAVIAESLLRGPVIASGEMFTDPGIGFMKLAVPGLIAMVLIVGVFQNRVSRDWTSAAAAVIFGTCLLTNLNGVYQFAEPSTAVMTKVVQAALPSAVLVSAQEPSGVCRRDCHHTRGAYRLGDTTSVAAARERLLLAGWQVDRHPQTVGADVTDTDLPAVPLVEPAGCGKHYRATITHSTDGAVVTVTVT